MKKILYTIFVSFIAFFAMPTFTAQAQGNLQFNQVLTNTHSLNSYANSGQLTVPAGKVWKLEAIGGTSSSAQFEINGTYFPIAPGWNLTLQNPIWLKAGDNFSIKNISGVQQSYYYSILEFNIVP